MPRRKDPFEEQALLRHMSGRWAAKSGKGDPLTFDTEGEILIFIERIAVLLALIRTFLRIHPSFLIRISSDINASRIRTIERGHHETQSGC
jgi:hypothetical protein